MKLNSGLLRRHAAELESKGNDYMAEVHLTLADLLDATTPRPWPPPEGVTRCLGWDKDDERWRVCIHEYGGWVFEDGLGPVRHWCQVWMPMPSEPEVGNER